jgi:UDP:flavonoid glycosyltransferase YjiC (YdhE family)
LFPAVSIAEKLGIKVIGGYLQPVDPTGSFPCLLLTLRNLGGPLNRFTYWLFWSGMWLLMRPITNAWRKDKLGLSPLPRSFLPGKWMKMRVPIMHGFSNHLVPRPKDWGDHLAVTGYWFLEDPARWQPPRELAEFMDAGPAPVYVGFGSMKTREPAATARVVLKALERANKRAIFQGGWAGLNDVNFPSSVFKLDSVSHDWLFSRSAALIHHGGGGTTGTGLRSGTPAITIPFYADQPFWGRRVAEIGAGSRPISRKELTVDDLTDAIQYVTNGNGVKARAAAVGETIRAENGIANAIMFINKVMAQ